MGNLNQGSENAQTGKCFCLELNHCGQYSGHSDTFCDQNLRLITKAVFDDDDEEKTPPVAEDKCLCSIQKNILIPVLFYRFTIVLVFSLCK